MGMCIFVHSNDENFLYNLKVLHLYPLLQHTSHSKFTSKIGETSKCFCDFHLNHIKALFLNFYADLDFFYCLAYVLDHGILLLELLNMFTLEIHYI